MAHLALHPARQVRLLDLYYGSPSEALFCEIDCFSLDELPPYDALSYAWNDAVTRDTEDLPIKTEIKCQDEVIQITPNLGRALQYLRFGMEPSQHRRLWVDKICINQHDVGEREQQIRYMGEIFGNAEHVIVWLGDSDADTAAVWKLMHDLRLVLAHAPSQTYHLALGWKPESAKNGVNGDISRGAGMLPLPPELSRLPPASHESWKCMDAFLRRAWFNRVWTLQEFVVSKKCHVMCGEYTLFWEDLFKGAVALHNGGYTHFWGAGNVSILMREGERERWQYGHRSSLKSLLCMTRSMETAEAHDKIFGLLPLARDTCTARLNVQYSRSLSDLFSEVARACIEEERNLSIFAEVDIRIDESSGIASWVPDWRERMPTPIILNSSSADQRPFGSAGSTEPWILSTQSIDTLKLRGFAVARITRILPVQAQLKLKNVDPGASKLNKKRWRPGVWERLYTKAAINIKIPLSVIRQPEERDYLPPMAAWARAQPGSVPSEMLHVALRRTLTADLYPRPDGRLSDSAVRHKFPAYDAWQQRDFDGMPGLPPRQVLWEHDRTLATTMTNRSAFIAGNDREAYLGIGSEMLREGDWICILLGGNTPFILRPWQCKNASDPFEIEEWSLVSECYIHGLMDGEAMEMTRYPEFRYKDFVLPSVGSSQSYPSKL